jgi:hypothetical protein
MAKVGAAMSEEPPFVSEIAGVKSEPTLPPRILQPPRVAPIVALFRALPAGFVWFFVVIGAIWWYFAIGELRTFPHSIGMAIKVLLMPLLLTLYVVIFLVVKARQRKTDPALEVRAAGRK